MLQYAKYLASEIITVTHGSRSYAASIIEFTFPEEALDYLQTTDDPRGKIVKVLFTEIGS